jgi:glycosyltransferase involved in cell wall biosynthesis
MRILFIHHIQHWDEQRQFLDELVSALLLEGHEIRVAGPGGRADAGFGGDRGSGKRRQLPGAFAELAALAGNVPAYFRLRRACRAFRPELIHERYAPYHLAAAWLARRTGLPYHVEVASPLAAGRSGGGLRRIARWAECHVWRSAGRMLAATGVLREVMADFLRSGGIAPRPIDVVPDGVLLERFLPAPFGPTCPAADPPRSVVLGCVGFVRGWHGLDAVIQALAAHHQDAGVDRPSVALMVIGAAPERGELEQLAAGLGIADLVSFNGAVDHARIPDLLADFDIALQPSADPDASPLAVFDYMAAGRAIVAPDLPSIREILEHERTALLFDPAAENGLWQAILRLIEAPGLRRALGTAARAELERRDYTWSGKARRIAALAAHDADAGGDPPR